MSKKMREDEAIDFTFTLGVDTAFRVAQSMSEESTLKKEDVPQVTVENMFLILLRSQLKIQNFGQK